VRERFVDLAHAHVNLLKSAGGVFEITIDGNLAFSKKALGRFPNDAEIETMLGN
jgi:selT/selW/selH-like putative selenoprotein